MTKHKTKKTKVLHVVGARPNLMKVAPVVRAMSRHRRFCQVLVHTGQHYDINMSDIFFKQLGIPSPDYNLGVGSGTHAVQTAKVMTRFEKVVDKEKPDLVLVYGDVNSTVAAALVCAKKGIKVGHVEAGLRSFDRTMPEELNRLVTDQLADYLFTPSRDANENLAREGIPKKKIFLVGNVMIDTLVRMLPKAKSPKLPGLKKDYVLVTLHRPSNVDDPAKLKKIMNALSAISRKVQVIFPVHPRTRARIKKLGLTLSQGSGLLLTQPLGYLEFLGLQKFAKAVITDSGGIQEETTYLKIPCFTLRKNTERPITIRPGSNVLIGENMRALSKGIAAILRKSKRSNTVPPLWDGAAAVRMARLCL